MGAAARGSAAIRRRQAAEVEAGRRAMVVYVEDEAAEEVNERRRMMEVVGHERSRKLTEREAFTTPAVGPPATMEGQGKKEFYRLAIEMGASADSAAGALRASSC